MHKILLTSAGGTAARNLIKSLMLGFKEIYIAGTDTAPEHLEASDTNDAYLVPEADPDQRRGGDYIDALNEIIDTRDIDLVIPQSDIEVRVIGENRGFVHAPTFLPDQNTISTCQDKLQFALLMNTSDVSVAKTEHVNDLNIKRFERAMHDIGGDKFWIRKRVGAGSQGALPVKSADNAYAWVKYWCEERGSSPDEWMLQEYLPGKEYAYQSVWRDGSLVIDGLRERLKHLFANQMPSGQSSTPSIARLSFDESIIETAVSSIKAVSASPHGVFCVDLREDVDGKVCVMEINAGRFFTTSDFFTDIGLNMPKVMIQLALEDDFDLQHGPGGVKWNWIRSVDHEPFLWPDVPWSSMDLRMRKLKKK